MATQTYRLKITVEEQDRRLFAAGAAALGIAPAQLVANLISDWVSVNRNQLAKLATPDANPEQATVTALDMLADAEVETAPTAAPKPRRSRRKT